MRAHPKSYAASSRFHKRTNIAQLILISAVWLLAGPSSTHAQITDRPLAGDVAERKIEQLRLDDSVLRSEISSARVARQAEIVRLEGRILQIEEQLRDLPSGSSSAQLAYVLGLAQTMAARSDEPIVTNDESGQPDRAIREIVIRDFALSVEIELLDARSLLLEKSREVKSLERLLSKGLATAAQLELQKMQRRRAEIQVERLEKQLVGLNRIYPLDLEANGRERSSKKDDE